MSSYYRKRFQKLNSFQKHLTTKKSIKQFESVAKGFMKAEFGEVINSLSKQDFKDL